MWQHKNMKESFLGALRGLEAVIKKERNAKVIFLIGIIVIIAGVYFNLSADEFAILIIVTSGVFVCEVFNTLVENILDIINPRYDNKIKILKDISSSAVLLSSIGAVAIGILIFLPKIFNLLH
ncbi:MAG: hypothetical protein B1H08_05525 [Candidatus Omnitrophica bacterium 4484_171]|nr:MAG: hypothetical protein B1H08_05525 [Candidatus Omnitrophica bacterium 4484_171]